MSTRPSTSATSATSSGAMRVAARNPSENGPSRKSKCTPASQRGRLGRDSCFSRKGSVRIAAPYAPNALKPRGPNRPQRQEADVPQREHACEPVGEIQAEDEDQKDAEVDDQPLPEREAGELQHGQPDRKRNH